MTEIRIESQSIKGYYSANELYFDHLLWDQIFIIIYIILIIIYIKYIIIIFSVS